MLIQSSRFNAAVLTHSRTWRNNRLLRLFGRLESGDLFSRLTRLTYDVSLAFLRYLQAVNACNENVREAITPRQKTVDIQSSTSNSLIVHVS